MNNLEAFEIIEEEIENRLMVLDECYQEGEDGYEERKRMERALHIVHDVMISKYEEKGE